jgi:hypothetical protein
MGQNVNHVDHVVWITHLRNQENRVRELGAMFNADFLGPRDFPDMGMRIYVSWESGLEVVAPLDDRTPQADELRKRLQERGEGFLAIVFGVRNIKAAREHVQKLGYTPSEIIEYQKPWGNKLTTFKEAIFTEFLGTVMALGEIVYADGVIGTRSDEPAEGNR